MIRKTLLAAALALVTTVAGAAEPQIRSFPDETVVQLGHAIYRQDRAAWVATDALAAAVPDFALRGVVGWIVVDAGDGQKVRFIRQGAEGPEAAYDVDVDASFAARVSEPVDRHLSPPEGAMFLARVSAAASLRQATVCRPGYNSVVVRDPEGPGWLVWMLAPMVKPGTIPIGIHYRFTVSADGRTVLRRDALSRTCGDLDPREGKPADQPTVAFGMTHLVSPRPVETHVFLELQAGVPFYVMAKDGIWAVDGGALRKVD